MFRFELCNTIGERHRAQRARKKMQFKGGKRTRLVEFRGYKIKPRRPLILTEKELVAYQQEIFELENKGLVVLYYDGKDISLEAALSLVKGQPKKPPYFPTAPVLDRTYKYDGQEKDDDPTVPIPEPEQKDLKPADEEKQEDTIEITGGVLQVEVESVEIDLQIESPQEASVLKIETQEVPVGEATQPEEDQEILTIKEGARFLGKSVSWLYKAIKKGKLETIVFDGKKGVRVKDLLALQAELKT